MICTTGLMTALTRPKITATTKTMPTLATVESPPTKSMPGTTSVTNQRANPVSAARSRNDPMASMIHQRLPGPANAAGLRADTTPLPKVCGTRGIDMVCGGSLVSMETHRRRDIRDDRSGETTIGGRVRRAHPRRIRRASAQGLRQEVVCAGRGHRLERTAGSRQVLPAAQDRVAVRHPAVGKHEPRAADRPL